MTLLDNLPVICLASAACGILGQCFGYYEGNRWWKDFNSSEDYVYIFS
jgi:hypothetical protein